MSLPHAPSACRPARLRAAATACVVALSFVAAGCTASGDGALAASDPASDPAPSSTAPPVSEASVTSSIDDGARDVSVDTTVDLSAVQGTLDDVRVAIGPGSKTLDGTLSADKTTWTSTQDLEPGLRYRVEAAAVDSAGLRAESSTVFRTQPLTLDEQTFASIAPLEGETVGVGMPVIVNFDVPVTNHQAIEKQLSVTSTPKQVGAWHWISNNEVRWRPKHYWKTGTDVTVDADINSVAAGNGIYGQESRSTSFHIGDSVVSRVHILSHTMTVFINGHAARSMPISAGKPGFITRSGTKVIIEKVRTKTMDAATVGIPKSSPEYYKLTVQYAMRVTYSGEFLHAAPWSVATQGIANTSHGCVGMSPTNAAWLFGLTKRGDVVEVSGSDRFMTLDNGYGDWNESFKDYKAGSAL